MGLSLCGPTSKMRGTSCGNMLILQLKIKPLVQVYKQWLPLAEVCSLMYIFYSESDIFMQGFIVLFSHLPCRRQSQVGIRTRIPVLYRNRG